MVQNSPTQPRIAPPRQRLIISGFPAGHSQSGQRLQAAFAGNSHALCAAARRGVETIIVFPARNDSFAVAAASRSYYADLLAAGVTIYEYVGGLLHTKSFTLDGEITLIGSANMDRRSFDLNYENNILLFDSAMTADMQRLQEHYVAKSNPITAAMVAQWPLPMRLWNNGLGMLGPLL